MKKELVICHKEREYACRLASYLNQRSDENYLVMVTTCPNEVFEILRTRTVDLLLLDEHYKDQKESLAALVADCYLLVARQTTGRDELMMYVPADEIYHKVMKRLFQKENRVDMEDFGMEAIFTFRQPKGENPGMELAYEKNYLYWEWSPFSEPVQGNRAEDFIYDIKRRREDMSACLEDYICRFKGYDILPAPKYYMDLRSMTKEDVEWAAFRVRELGYTGVMGHMSLVSIGNISLLQAFSRIYVDADESWFNSHGYEQFMQYLDYVNLSRDIVEVLGYGAV